MKSFLDFVEASMDDKILFSGFIKLCRERADVVVIEQFFLAQGFAISKEECEALMVQADELQGKGMSLTGY